jgi:Protein of unknown function (DUF3313)
VNWPELALVSKREPVMNRKLPLMVAAVGTLLFSTPAAALLSPDTWDGLVKVESKQMDLTYLQPGADFRLYTKVLLDPVEVAFHKNWRRSQNSSDYGLSGTISNRDIEDAITKGVAESNAIFEAAWTKGGYEVVSEPGPDVLRIRAGVLNIWVSAPEQQLASRSLTFARQAGEATFFVEARDSLTGALLGRAVDKKVAGDRPHGWRTSVSNRADFREIVEDWARDGVRGLSELKALSPIKL